ncbi:srr1 domain-containing [Trichoderma arundinaceum]|uniref:Srr1 domain-containing n=1 Tax=Trichoderma arundinaceum TaxID=490622 RepID=A0A395NZ85_TRIAR|nr:srr1 domain-containing [Trichoderma arundinaceum]
MDEGWTTVKGRHRRPKNTKSAPSSLLSPATRTVPHLEVTEMKDEYNTVLRKFMKSTSYHIIRTIAWEFTLNAEQIPITKAICLGIGTFDPSDGSLAIKQKAHKQLAAFLVMVEELEIPSLTKPQQLEKHTGGHIECIFQEPMFTPGDISFLNEMGHRVVESPVGSEAVDSQTFLYGVHLYKDIYSMSLQGELPAVFVGTGWDAWSEYVFKTPFRTSF